MPPKPLYQIMPHRGQVPILTSTARHRVIRCGRRFGKSTLGIIATLGSHAHGVDGVFSREMRVGWFAPEYKYLDEIWRLLRRYTQPMTVRSDDSKHRIELRNGSVIEGWTLNDNHDAGRSRKYDLVICDEAGLVANLRRWWDGAAQATLIDYGGRAMLLGTPNPIGPQFDEFFDEAGTIEPEWASFTATTFDNDHLPKAELRNIQRRRAKMPDWLWLQEYMAIPCDAASGFFPRSLVQEMRRYATEPVWQGRIDIPASERRDILISRGAVEAVRFADDPGRGPWSLWFDPLDGPPDCEHGYVMGCDIGAGVGASNTTFSLLDVDTGQKLAEFASPRVGAEDAARLACIAGLWFGGRFNKAARICPEVNGGQGQAFAKILLDLRYPAIFSMRQASDRFAQRRFGDIKTSDEIGFMSTGTTREALLTDYRAALKTREFTNPSDIALAELLTYSYDRRGRIVSVRREADDPTADLARMPHGDRVIADALAWHAASHANPAPAPKEPEHDPSSFQARKAAREKSKKKKAGYRMA